MMHKATKLAFVSAAVFTGACVAQAASAAMIDSFAYTVDSAFTSFNGTGGDGTITPSDNGNGIYSSDPTKLSWGTVRGGTTPSSPQSSISITPKVNGSITVNGAAQPGATFHHNNRVIPDTSNTLNKFTLGTKLYLTPKTSGGTLISDIDPLAFSSFFTETENAAPCGFNSQSTCDDIFVLTNHTEAANNPIATQHFTADGTLYTVALNANGIGTLSDAECDIAGADHGCVGFVTQEGRDNAFDTNFTITTAPSAVPGPSNLAMLAVGLGLIGFGFYARRRNFRG